MNIMQNKNGGANDFAPSLSVYFNHILFLLKKRRVITTGFQEAEKRENLLNK